MKRTTRLIWLAVSGCAIALAVADLPVSHLQGDAPAPSGDLGGAYVKDVQPLLKKYCYECHSTKVHKSELDLERFESLGAIRKDLKPWPHLVEQVEVGEMPPKGKPQPSADERKLIVAWGRAMLDMEAKSRTGDPGKVPLRRLSNAEYDATIRDLTGVDLRPTREFPADGAAGEGFTNAAESLSDITPTLFTRYLNAAKDIADHAVLLPDGFRFSLSKTRRDWTDEGTARLRKFYSAIVAGDGKLVLQPFLLATVRHRDALAAGKFEEVAAIEKVNPKYLRALWEALTAKQSSEPLDAIRAKWLIATEKDVAGLSAEIAAWQSSLWNIGRVGSYIRATWGSSVGAYTESPSRQAPNNPSAVDSVPLRYTIKPAMGKSEVALYLAANERGALGPVIWHRPRIEMKGKPPLLLRDYADFGPAFEVDYPSAFANSANYLAAVVELANDAKASPNAVAKQHGLDVAFLNQWVKVLAVAPRTKAKDLPAPAPLIPADSILGRWRVAAADAGRQADTEKLAKEVETVLAGPRPANDKDVNRVLYDRFVTVDGPLFAGVDLAKFAKRHPNSAQFGLPKERFAKPDGDSLIVASDKVVEIRLPAALLAGREFVVDARLEGAIGQRLVRVHVAEAAPDASTRWDGSAVLASAEGAGYKQLVAGYDEFRKVVPLFLCFPQVVPSDEVVTLKMFHREDEPLHRLFLTSEQINQLDRLWTEQRFISRQPVAEYDYLPQFMGFTTQDTPKVFQQFFIDRKPLFKKHADEFLKDEEAAIPKQLTALANFASRAFRRPLDEKEKGDLAELYQNLRQKGVSHDEAFRGVLTRVLVAPPFLFRIETAPAGDKAASINDWELATRLSYFLWSSAPDDELRKLAAAGQLRDPKVLAEQTRRMLKDERLRSLAIEFGTQWIHVREFDGLKEKNEKLYPTFNAALRKAIYEESILFFLDLFQSDREVTRILDADYTFLDETLAKHYGIPGVTGPQWRRVEGVRKYGRGGILGLASVQAKQSGASRTSPVLRGNWVVETLLGEKLPRPPANVPILPDEEGGADKRTTRQQVEKHVSDASCASCHVRIDPFGFAFENFDAIGRLRLKESSGLPVDSKAKLRDGTEFEGIDGLRDYLLSKKKDVIVRLFCQRLLGYALGRATTLSDTTLINEMVAELNKNEGRVSAAVLAIIRSPQFRMVRGLDTITD